MAAIIDGSGEKILLEPGLSKKQIIESLQRALYEIKKEGTYNRVLNTYIN